MKKLDSILRLKDIIQNLRFITKETMISWLQHLNIINLRRLLLIQLNLTMTSIITQIQLMNKFYQPRLSI